MPSAQAGISRPGKAALRRGACAAARLALAGRAPARRPPRFRARTSIEQVFDFGGGRVRIAAILERRRVDVDVERRAAQRAVGRQHAHARIADDSRDSLFQRRASTAQRPRRRHARRPGASRWRHADSIGSPRRAATFPASFGLGQPIGRHQSIECSDVIGDHGGRAVRAAVSDSSRTAFMSDSTASCPFLPSVTLQTMDSSAAPIAPMMAAALPPPGVGAAARQFIQKCFYRALSYHVPTIPLAMP